MRSPSCRSFSSTMAGSTATGDSFFGCSVCFGCFAQALRMRKSLWGRRNWCCTMHSVHIEQHQLRLLKNCIMRVVAEHPAAAQDGSGACAIDPTASFGKLQTNSMVLSDILDLAGRMQMQNF